jgi:hypothetical protein
MSSDGESELVGEHTRWDTRGVSHSVQVWRDYHLVGTPAGSKWVPKVSLRFVVDGTHNIRSGRGDPDRVDVPGIGRLHR